MAQYSYRPLSRNRHIRLLSFRPANPLFDDTDSDYIFNLTSSPITWAHIYETVSYTWGDASKRRNITMEDGTSLSITESLYEAIPYLIAQSTTDRLWIDQICINQADISERNVQVAWMGDIYSSAAGTLVWLGMESVHMMLLQSIVQVLRIDNKQYRLFGTMDIIKDRNHLADVRLLWDWLLDRAKHLSQNEEHSAVPSQGNLRLFKSAWESCLASVDGDVTRGILQHIRDMIFDLYSRKWFTRVWVLQEVILSKTVEFVIGKWTFSSTQLEYTVYICDRIFKGDGPLEKINYDPYLAAEGGRTLLFTISMASLHDKGMEIDDVLREMHDFELRGLTRATDSKDLVYGVLGICRNEVKDAVGVDYARSVVDVFTQAARVAIARRRSLDVLLWCEGARTCATGLGNSIDLPTWVPDWSRKQEMKLSSSSTMRFSVCSYKHRADEEASHSSRRLLVRGKEIAKIATALPPEVFDAVTECYTTAAFGAPYCLPSVLSLRNMLSKLILGLSAQETEARLLMTCLHWGTHTRNDNPELRKALAAQEADQYSNQLLQGWPGIEYLCKMMANYSGGNSKDEPFEEARRFWLSYSTNRTIKCEHGRPIFYSAGSYLPCDLECQWSPVRAWAYGSRDLRYCRLRSVLFSSDQSFILSTANAQEGDRVCILHGCSYPVLLRPVPSGEYQYVGGCFIEGGIDSGSIRVNWHEHEADHFVLV